MGRTKSIKVLQMNSMNMWGGGEVHVLLLCKQLLALGDSVVLACRSGSAIDQRAKEEQIPVLNLPLKGAIDIKSAWRIANYCREHSVDIIHAHNGRDYWIAVLAKCFYPNLKVIITRHILSPLKETLLHRWLYKKIDRVISVSQAVKSRISVFPSEKITVIHNGIDINVFYAAKPGMLGKELNLSPATKIVGMVGRVHPSKGHATFLESIPAIVSQCPDVVFVIVGDGEYVTQLKKTNAPVHFLGKRNNIPEIMKDLDVFVMASLNEPFGLVTVEAMAAGAVVVAANSGGTAEIITDEETGLLVPPQDPEKLAQAVIRGLSNTELAVRLKAGGIQHAKKYDIQEMVTKTRNVYESARDNL
ncbi:Glycosyltransferase involved in cell wall bisynthesis [Propionispora vibrioides]|uniref:Glycosyltransferase involved in cell wall bisynthesis n=2 Tax=Propionispora vibrioides TaxID=112903 RepID=A0A1H8S3D1_9FIRM|nr:Glycosyltransferase involved in cell wall bisynthesis [Propionispora vibrioides]